MKRILVVVEQFTIGGLETHIRGELQMLAHLGYEVHLVVGHLFNDSLLPDSVRSVSKVSIDSSASVQSVIDSTERLRELIRQNQIEVVHVHPFASIVPAFLAAELEQVPVVITLHGPASITNYGSVGRFLLTSLILPAAARVVTVSREIFDLVRPFVETGRLVEIPNGVALPSRAASDMAIDGEAGWLVVSRLDEDKIVGVLDFIRKAKHCGIPSVKVAGDGPARQRLENLVDEEGLGDFVDFLGASSDIDSLMYESVGVGGMGRVVLEGIAAGRPVVLIGYDGVKGVVDEGLFARASVSNFSGRGLQTVSEEVLCRAELHQPKDALYRIVRDRYSETVVWNRFVKEIKQLSFESSPLLAAFYRVLGCEKARLGTDVFCRSEGVVSIFEGLISGQRFYDPRVAAGLTAVARQLESERTARIEQNLSATSVRFDAELAELRQQLASVDQMLERLLSLQEREQQTLRQKMQLQTEYIQQIEWENDLMKNSLSWRATRPIRAAGYFLRNPVGTIYTTAKSIYWALPPEIRNRLQGARHHVIRWLRKNGAGMSLPVGKHADGSSDISWAEFQGQVLNNRENYRGVFVQLSTIPWKTPLFQRPQHMALALSRLGYLVIFRTPLLGGDAVEGFREVENNVWITNSGRLEEISGAFYSVYSTDSVVEIEELRRLEKGTLIYEYIDHIDPQISGDNASIARLECLKDFAFSGGADLIVSSAQALYDEAVAAVGPGRVVLVPNGVDTAHYRKKLSDSLLAEIDKRARQFREKYSVVVGYFGALAPWLWYEALDELVRLRPDVGFIFIGPDYYGGASQLSRAENVLYLGPVDYQVLPVYGAVFDVCFIPFAPGDVAKTTSPLKLFEYFAMEKPVVSTSFMSECVAFSEVFHGDSARGLAEAIDEAVKVSGQPEFKERLRRLADSNSWQQRAVALSEALDRLGGQSG